MKTKLLSISLMILFTAISVSGFSQLRIDKESSKKEISGQELIVGNDKDDHGCIGSAGYVWSKIKRDCIRTYEIGLALLNSQDSTATKVCYIIIDDELELIEVYLPELSESILLHQSYYSWVSSDGSYSLNATDDESFQLYDYDNKLIYHSGNLPEGHKVDVMDEFDEAINEFGIIASIEDGQYPMFVVTIEFPERQMTNSFNLNIEELSIDMNQLYKMEGEYVSLYYTSDMEDFLYDMHFEGKTIFSDYVPEFDPEMKVFTGVLMDAESLTTSDLPSTIRVVNDNGEEHKFEYYIDEEMLAVNGKEVKAFYSIRYTDNIIDIKPSK